MRWLQVALCAASAGTFPPVRRSVTGDGIFARSGTVPAKAMRCNARLAFVLWGRLGEERKAACGLESEWHVRRYVPNMPEGAVLQLGENVVAEPSKREIDARAYQLWEQAGRPEGREAEFWRLAEQELRNEDKGSPTRTPDTL